MATTTTNEASFGSVRPPPLAVVLNVDFREHRLS
jgi:hypothetical protein